MTMKGIKQEKGKVDSSIKSQVERTPKSTVHLHKVKLVCRLIPPIFHHSDTMPAKSLEFRQGVVTNSGMPPTFPERGHSSSIRHFMKAAMLESQLATLEVPADAVIVDAALSPPEQVEQIRAALAL